MKKEGGMRQPLTSSDHLSEAMGEAEEQTGGYELSRSSDGERPANVRQDSLSGRFGLLTVGEIQSKDLRTLLWNGLRLTAIYLLVGGLWFMITDQWSFTNTVYFVVISLLTIGYGDLIVTEKGEDRLLNSLLIVLGLVTLGVWAAYAARAARTFHSSARVVDAGRAIPDFDVDLAVKKCRQGLLERLIWVTVVILTGAVVFMIGEESSFNRSIYWVIVTASTVGYGDVVPTTIGMKWFTVFYSIVATVSMFETLRYGCAYPCQIWTIRAEAKVFHQFDRRNTPGERAEVKALAETAVTEILGNPPDERPTSLSRSDFALSMLLMLERISHEDYQQAARLFDNLDVAGDSAVIRVPQGDQPKGPTPPLPLPSSVRATDQAV